MAQDREDSGTRQVVLELIIEKGPVAAATLADMLSLTPAAIRRHLIALEEDGQIEAYKEPPGTMRGRGRPARNYVATDAGRSTQPGEYSALANRALTYLMQIAGPQAVEEFANSRSSEVERRYAPVVHAAGPDRAAKVRALADALAADGYAATVREVGSGMALQLCQGNCPVQDVATEFPQLCEAETQAFARLLDVHVQRLASLAAGEHVCTTNVPIAVPMPKYRRNGGTPKDRVKREGNNGHN